MKSTDFMFHDYDLTKKVIFKMVLAVRGVPSIPRPIITASLMRTAGFLVVICALAAVQKSHELQGQDADRVEALLDLAARFEAVGRINEARARVLQVQELESMQTSPALALKRLDTGCFWR